MTKGQRAMAVAMLYPKPGKIGAGRGNKKQEIISDFSAKLVTQARTVAGAFARRTPWGQGSIQHLKQRAAVHLIRASRIFCDASRILMKETLNRKNTIENRKILRQKKLNPITTTESRVTGSFDVASR
jgi:hypothetical protein